MKPLVQVRDVEALTIALMAELLEDEDCTVGLGVPEGWTPTSTPHLQVASDAQFAAWPVATRDTVRLVARGNGRTATVALCRKAQGLLVAYNGDDQIVQTSFLTGPLWAIDPDTRHTIASATVRVTTRTEPVDTGS